MAVAVVLLAVVALVAPSVSATTDRSLESPPIIDICLDDPSYVFGANGDRDCAWVASQKPKKKKRLCRRKKIKNKCRDTCDNCDAEPQKLKDSCPKKQSWLKYPGPCDKYETNLACEYGYVYAGCDESGGQEDDLICTPTTIYQCEDDGGGEKNWELIIADLFPCSPTSERPYGAKCDPKECPPAEPLEGAFCSWYEGRGSCGYDPLWFGCDYEQLECKASINYDCNPVSNTWEKSIEPQPRCAGGPGTPYLQPCDIGDPKPLPFGPCDGVEPTAGDLCTPGIDESCLGGYSVRGCNSDTLFCSPGVAYSCSDPDGVGIGPRWTAESLPQIECIADDPLWDTDCDPFGCPPSKPPPAASCSGVDPSEMCLYDYKVLGCTPEELECTATTSVACGPDDLWTESTIDHEECMAIDPLWDTDCSPLECPPKPPNEGSECSLETEICSYDYKVRGCTPDALACTALTVFKCNQRGLWKDKSPQLPTCAAEDPLWDTDCTPACPIEKPAIGRACDLIENDEACYYDYEIRGCDPSSFACVPTTALACGPSERWEDTGLAHIVCTTTEKDSLWGTPCTSGDDLLGGPR